MGGPIELTGTSPTRQPAPYRTTRGTETPPPSTFHRRSPTSGGARDDARPPPAASLDAGAQRAGTDRRSASQPGGNIWCRTRARQMSASGHAARARSPATVLDIPVDVGHEKSRSTGTAARSAIEENGRAGEIGDLFLSVHRGVRHHSCRLIIIIGVSKTSVTGTHPPE
jgi:hypothetical protein